MDTIIETIKFAELGAMPKQLQLFDAMLTNQGETLLAICAENENPFNIFSFSISYSIFQDIIKSHT